MTLIIGPNISLDQTVSVPHVTVGAIHRAPVAIKLAGGKGANVARAMRRLLFGDPLLCGCFGGAIGAAVEGLLVREHIRYRPFRIQSETRICFSIADETTGEQTEVYEQGAPLSEAESEGFIALAEQLLDEQTVGHSRWVGLTGSLPPGMPDDLYARLIASAHAHGLHTLLDAKGEALRAGLTAVPDLLKINATELGDALGQPTLDQAEPAEIAEATAQAISHIPGGVAIITLGARGAVVVATGGGRWHIEAPRVKAISPVGSGDAVAGALLVFFDGDTHTPDTHTPDTSDERSLVSATSFAMAVGAANAQHLGASQFTEAEVRALTGQAQMREL